MEKYKIQTIDLIDNEIVVKLRSNPIWNRPFVQSGIMPLASRILIKGQYGPSCLTE